MSELDIAEELESDLNELSSETRDQAIIRESFNEAILLALTKLYRDPLHH